jgi:hypothetical protein
MIAACYGGGEPSEAPEEENTGEAEAALTCEDWCSDRLMECTWECPPDDPWLPSNPCIDQCYMYYSYCINDC